MLLWGTWSWANLLSGLLVALGVLVLLPLPHAVGGGRVRPLPRRGPPGDFALDLSAPRAAGAPPPAAGPRGRRGPGAAASAAGLPRPLRRRPVRVRRRGRLDGAASGRGGAHGDRAGAAARRVAPAADGGRPGDLAGARLPGARPGPGAPGDDAAPAARARPRRRRAPEGPRAGGGAAPGAGVRVAGRRPRLRRGPVRGGPGGGRGGGAGGAGGGVAGRRRRLRRGPVRGGADAVTVVTAVQAALYALIGGGALLGLGRAGGGPPAPGRARGARPPPRV